MFRNKPEKESSPRTRTKSTYFDFNTLNSITGWLLNGGPEKTRNCVKVVPSINKLPYQILNCISLATQKHPNLLCLAFHRPEVAKRL